MSYPRLDKLAHTLTHHSVKIKPNEVVLIESIDTPPQMTIALIKAVRSAGGLPIVEFKEARIQRELIRTAKAMELREIADCEVYRMQKIHAYIGLRGSRNASEMTDLPHQARQRYIDFWLTPLNDIRMKKKWILLNWPRPETAQRAQMSTEAFENLFFDTCLVDYTKMEQAVSPLVAILNVTDEIHIVGEGTDLRFSIRDMPVRPCTGEINMPDGECFTAPVRDSVNGTILFNTPTIYQGSTFTDIRLRFENGKIVEASANDTEKLNNILDTDEGARYVGKFSIAFNPFMQQLVGNIYDQKVAHSFHISIGMASAINWSLIMRQNPEYGGGEIYCDGLLIRKDGDFVHPALEALNPSNFRQT